MTTQRLVSLIGMPTTGKTKVGKELAKALGCTLVDIDDRIMQCYGESTIQKVIDRLADTFTDAEGRITIETVDSLSGPTVIATGGSIVYNEPAMAFLRAKTHIVYLRATYETIDRRVKRRERRGAGTGIVYGPNETLYDLYKRRTPLYERYAHRIVDTDRNRGKIACRLALRLAQEQIA